MIFCQPWKDDLADSGWNGKLMGIRFRPPDRQAVGNDDQASGGLDAGPILSFNSS
jgi:hypothetical protein